MVILVALTPVFLNGVIFEEGERFSCNEKFAKKLIENESAKLIVESQEQPNVDLKGLTKEELLLIVETNNIKDITSQNKKEEIIKAILNYEAK